MKAGIAWPLTPMLVSLAERCYRLEHQIFLEIKGSSTDLITPGLVQSLTIIWISLDFLNSAARSELLMTARVSLSPSCVTYFRMAAQG